MSDTNECFNDSLREMVSKSNRSAKELALYLWPEMTSLGSATAKFHAKLNSDSNDAKDGHFTPEQVVALMNFTGQYQPLHFWARACQHETPRPVSATDVQLRAIVAVENATAGLTSALSTLSQFRGVR